MLTNKEAIQILSTRDKYGVPCGYTSGYQEALDMAVDALNKTAWIPVSERLPGHDIDDIVLASVGYDVEFGKCNSNGVWEVWTGFHWDVCELVNAWMPLPEPYKPESENKE